jgi:hypothetical protein
MFSVSIGRTVEDSWLLTCANEGRLTPKIVHLDVNTQKIRSDKDLAMVLREHYENINRRWLRWTRLRGLTTIEFVQFEVHRNRLLPQMKSRHRSIRTRSKRSTSSLRSGLTISSICSSIPKITTAS